MSSLSIPERFWASRSFQRRAQFLARTVIALLAMSFAALPVAWIISASLDPSNTLLNQGLIPRRVSLANYQRLLSSQYNPFLLWMWNSIKVAGTASTLGVFLTALSAFAFSRFRFRGRRSLLLTVLLIQVFPNMLTMVALFLLLQQIGNYIPWLGLNTHGGLILVYLGGVLGFNTWLMKGFFDSVPRDLDESALMDGASHWKAFWYIILPLVRPIMAVVGLLTFIGTYSDFVLARVMIQSAENYTLAVGMSLFIAGQFTQEWGVFAAGALMGALPITIIFLLLQDYIVSGLTQGAVKG